jgi:hypothetical protein
MAAVLARELVLAEQLQLSERHYYQQAVELPVPLRVTVVQAVFLL